MSAAPDQMKAAGDALSAFVAVATLANWLPAVAALFTILWTGIRIWETATVQRVRACVADRIDRMAGR